MEARIEALLAQAEKDQREMGKNKTSASSEEGGSKSNGGANGSSNKADEKQEL